MIPNGTVRSDRRNSWPHRDFRSRFEQAGRNGPDAGRPWIVRQCDRNAHAKARRWPQAASAPKGRHTTAQGNALWKRAGINAEALKGRNPGAARPRFRPFRASDLAMNSLPRALPWAFLFRPFGAEEGHQSRLAWNKTEIQAVALKGRRFTRPGRESLFLTPAKSHS